MTVRLPHRIIGCTTKADGLVHCVNCPSKPSGSQECEVVRLALEATVKYNGRAQDVPLPLTEEQRSRIRALRAAEDENELYALAGVAEITCNVRREEP